MCLGDGQAVQYIVALALGNMSWKDIKKHGGILWRVEDTHFFNGVTNLASCTSLATTNVVLLYASSYLGHLSLAI